MQVILKSEFVNHKSQISNHNSKINIMAAKKKVTKKSIPIKVIIRKAIAIRKKSSGINEYINNVKGNYKSMSATTNPWFPASSLSMPLSTFNTNIGLLDTAEISFTSNPPTITKGVRDAAKKLIEENVTVLLADVQRIANANPVHAIEIIESAGFEVETKAGKTETSGPENTDVHGTILIKAIEGGYHEWGQSPDNVNWTPLRSTSGRERTVTGLIPLSKWYFRSAPILRNNTGVEGAWTVYPIFTVT